MDKNEASKCANLFDSRGHLTSVAQTKRAKAFKESSLRLLAYLRLDMAKIILILLLAACGAVLLIVAPQIIGMAINHIAHALDTKTAIDFQYIYKLLIILIVLYGLSSLVNFVQQRSMVFVVQKIITKLRNVTHEKINQLSLGALLQKQRGDLLSRMINDIDTVSTTLQQSLSQIVTSFVTIVGALVMMLYISPLLTIIGLIIVPLAAIVARTVAKKSRPYFQAMQAELGAVSAKVSEGVSGHLTIKLNASEEQFFKEFSELNDKLYSKAWIANFISGLIMPLMNFINNLGYIVVAVFGGILCIYRIIAIGDIQAFVQYLRYFMQPIVQLANISNIIQATVASAERIFEILDAPLEDAVTQKKFPAEIEGNISFDNVYFAYDKETKVLENFSLQIPAGKTLAIVGHNGAGKTTLANILLRFYEIESGSIKLDAQNLHEYSFADTRSKFGIVTQEPWIFRASIFDNITLGRNFDINKVYSAARAAHIDELITHLPNGYNTIIEDESSLISQGLKQLISIARVFVYNPPILILDEASSSIDSHTELLIQKSLARLITTRTSIIIAHRLTTIKNAGHIIVMDHGRIIEQGRHTELLTQQGFYAQLYQDRF